MVLGLLLVVGCGASEERIALAVEHPQWITVANGPQGASLRFDTECADVAEISVEPGAGVDGVPLVTVWGRPRTGRCRPEVVVTVPPGTTRVEDATTGMVVDLPAP